MAEAPRSGPGEGGTTRTGAPASIYARPTEGGAKHPLSGGAPSSGTTPEAPKVGLSGHSHARGDAQAGGHIADDTGPQVETTLQKHPDELAPPFERTPMGPPPTGPGTDPSPGSRALQARSMHDHGQYRDKIAVSDPAMSPLGTDSESAGHHVPEGAIEPMAPMGGAAPHDHTPDNHARGEVPQRSTALVWTLGAVAAVLLVGFVVLMLAA